MDITCRSIDELKLLVMAIDLNLISTADDRVHSGFGTAGVIITDEVPKDNTLLPIGTDENNGVVFGSDVIIVTPCPREFAWFASQLLHSNMDGVNPVELYSELPYAHATFCSQLIGHYRQFYIKEELLFICNWLSDKINESRNNNKNAMVFNEKY